MTRFDLDGIFSRSCLPYRPTVTTSKQMDQPQLIFLGSGSSTGTPRIPCLLKQDSMCAVCSDSLKEGSKNRRRNPSVMIQYQGKNIMIDCGIASLTTYSHVQRKILERIHYAIITHKISHIDAVLLTHSHADAVMGLDDLREFTEKSTLPVYIRKSDFPVVNNVFPYLVDSSKSTGSGYVSSLAFNIFEEPDELQICGVTIRPLLLEHGVNSTSFGYQFGKTLYFSDAINIPEATHTKIVKIFPSLQLLSSNSNNNSKEVYNEIELMIVDALRIKDTNASHWSLEQALDVIRKYRPKKALLIGMSHELHYENMNKQLALLQESEGLDVQLSFDGLKVPIVLDSL